MQDRANPLSCRAQLNKPKPGDSELCRTVDLAQLCNGEFAKKLVDR